VAERTKATVLKTVSGATRSWVRIPVLPPPIREFAASAGRAASRNLERVADGMIIEEAVALGES
jgi:hypothetical protein